MGFYEIFCILLLTGCLALRNVNAGTLKSEKFVSYEDFGARGDGITDDQKVIVSAHAYANKHNLPVKVRDNARYYIGGGDRIINIMTDTDFGNAEFIIDDTNVKKRSCPVFIVKSRKKLIN